MTRPMSPLVMNGPRTLSDDSLPLTCIIEGSQLVEGHGVMSNIEFVLIIDNKYKIRNIQFEFHVVQMIYHIRGLLQNVFENLMILIIF